MYVWTDVCRYPAPFSPFYGLTPANPSFLPSFLRTDFSSVPCICIRDVYFFFLFRISLFIRRIIIRVISTLRRRLDSKQRFKSSFYTLLSL